MLTSSSNAHSLASRPSIFLSAGVLVATLLLLPSVIQPDPDTPASDVSAEPSSPAPRDCFVIDDFESYQGGDRPDDWRTNKGRSLVPADSKTMTDGHQYVIREEGGNKFVRASMRNYAYRLIKLSDDHFPAWNASQCPVLAWRWRVNEYPKGADETDDDNNDVAAAVYVTFSRNWYGRPKSIKYTYSSTQPVGTTADYGSLKVLVVASAADGSPTGEWMNFERNVMRDYQQLFGEAPDDDTPLGIQLFVDADVSSSRTAVTDFDDVHVKEQ